MAAKVGFSVDPHGMRDIASRMQRQVAHAATAAMDATKLVVSAGGREVIRRAGFSKKWENAWRVTRYPAKGDTLDPALWIYHKISYAAVFQDGAVIKGSPLLWLPLRSAPKLGRSRMTARAYIKQIGPLHRINRPGKPPLLAGYIRGYGKSGKVTVAKLRSGERRRQSRGTKGLISVPMFIGLPSVKIRKRFDFGPVWHKAMDVLSDEYARNLPEGR